MFLSAVTWLVPGAASAQNAVTQPYLMTVDACDPSSTCSGPQKTIYFLQSSDGVNWQPVPGFTPFTGSVPTVVRRGNTIYLVEQDGRNLSGRPEFNVMKLFRYHLESGIWDPVVLIDLTDSQNPGPYIDTDLTLDSQGNIVLVYDTNPSRCAASTCDKPIRIAFEVPGSDGGSFVTQTNDAVTIPVADQGNVYNPYAFFDGSQYILYAPTSNGPLPQASLSQISVYTSPTIGGPYSLFTGLPNGQLIFTGGFASGYYNTARGQYWHYVTNGTGAMYQAITSTLTQQLALPPASPQGPLSVATPVITTSTLGLPADYQLNHPKFAVNANGPRLLPASAAGTVTTPAQITFAWQDLTRSPVYALEFCVGGPAGCFAIQAGAVAFDSPAQTFWFVDGADPNMRQFIGQRIGAGPVIAYSRTGNTITPQGLLVGATTAEVQYRIFPFVIGPASSLNVPPGIPPGVLGLPPGGTSSLPASVSFR